MPNMRRAVGIYNGRITNNGWFFNCLRVYLFSFPYVENKPKINGARYYPAPFCYLLHLSTTPCIAQQNLSNGVNVVCEGSPSRILKVLLISLGITTRPKSSIRLTIPVAFIIYKFSLNSNYDVSICD